MIKKLLSTILAISLGVSSLTYAFAEDEIKVNLNDKPIQFDTAPQLINDRTMVPMRAIFEAIGATVDWNDGIITASYKDKQMTLSIDNPVAYITENGIATEYTLDSAPVLINSRTLVPVRFIGEQLGLLVDWNNETQTVYLAKCECPAAIIEIENYGKIVIELYPEVAPITAENFIKLAKSGFYDGLIFHRVIEDFMIQGGGYDLSFQQKPANPIKGEFASNGIENNLKHTRGVISMARTNVKDSASSQFFIMHQDSPHLDGEYAAFGKVVSGIDVVDKIASAETASQDIPVEPVVIKSIVIEE